MSSTISLDHIKDATQAFIWLFLKGFAIQGSDGSETISYKFKAFLDTPNPIFTIEDEANGVKVDGSYYLLAPHYFTVDVHDRTTTTAESAYFSIDDFSEIYSDPLTDTPSLYTMNELGKHSAFNQIDFGERARSSSDHDEQDRYFIITPPEPKNCVITFNANSEAGKWTGEDTYINDFKMAFFDDRTMMTDYIVEKRNEISKIISQETGFALSRFRSLNILDDKPVCITDMEVINAGSKGTLSTLIADFISQESELKLNDDILAIKWVASSLDIIALAMSVRNFDGSNEDLFFEKTNGHFHAKGDTVQGVNYNIIEAALNKIELFLVKEVGINQNLSGERDFTTKKQTSLKPPVLG